jgi:hypothetical protein
MLLWAQVTPLNSLVARVDQPRGPIPAECEQGLAPTPPLRVEVRDIDIPEPEAAEPVAPPSGALRTALQETQLALTRNDRPAFNAALARTKALLEGYPTGAERRTAEEIVRLHETAARLWDAQYETPFFAETDPEYALVRDLPGYAEAIRRNTLTDDRDRRFYPTGESRAFVADLAGERLQRLGIHRSTRVTREERPRASASTSTSARRTSPRRGSTSRPTRKPAAATPAPRSPNPTAPPTVAAAPAPAPTKSSSPAAGDVTPAPASPPVVDVATETTLPTSTASVPEDVATDTMTTTAPATIAPDTVADTATTTNVVPAEPATTAGRSVILPTILILIGLGVLIMLFRASN